MKRWVRPSWASWDVIYARIVDGGWGSFAACCLVSMAWFFFILNTVNRYSELYLSAANVPARAMGWMSAWREHGFFRYGGLLVYPEEGMLVYKTHSGSYMWLPYLVHRISRALNHGQNSFRAMAIFFQLLVAVNASVIGIFGTRIARRIGATPTHSLLLGIAVASVYQTFPANVVSFLGPNPLTPVVLYAALFWLLVQDGALEEASTRRQRWLVAASIFLLTISYSIATAVFFVAAFVLAVWLLLPATVKPRNFFFYVLLPVVAANAVHGAQLLWIAWTMPEAGFTGNLNYHDFLWRSGLDGSQEFFNSAWDVFTRRQMSMGYVTQARVTESAEMMTWKWLFIFSVISLIANGVLAVWSKHRFPILFLAGAVGCYLIHLFVFTQGVIIHPDCWDVVIGFPLMLSLFVILPANVLVRGKTTTSLPVLVAVLAAFCLSLAQLRSYAITFPVGPS